MLAELLALSLFFCHTALGSLYTSTLQIPHGRSYDYIIVGAGTAGSVLGRRLSEDRTKNVLIIEAGINPDYDVNTQVPFFVNFNFRGAADWNFTTVRQPNVNGRELVYPQGKTLGGSSSIGLLLYNRGGRDDYDRWGRITGDSTWSWDALFPYMLKVEHPSTSPDSNLTDKWIPSAHGTEGPLTLAVYSETYEFPSDQLLIDATAELSDEFTFNPDLSAGDSIGIGWATITLENGARASAWTDYLRPVLGRPNLDVVINTQVTKVLQTGWKNGTPVFQGVEYAASENSARGTFTASREVILSAGAILTPQLLMLSGIGDNATLTSHGIPTIVNNSNVGLNMQEHPRLSAIYDLVPGVPTIDPYRENATLGNEKYEIWKENGTGPYSIVGPRQIGFFRNPTEGAPFNTTDPSAGPTSGHYQMAYGTQWSSYVEPVPTEGSYFTIITNTVSTLSFGNVTLQSASPFDAPLIDPALFANYYDLATMREGIKAGYRLAQSRALSTNFIAQPHGSLGPVLANGTDEAIETYAMNYTTALFHPTGTARMAYADGTGGVLDSSLKVMGTVGLRVVDAAAIPRTPSSNSMAPVIILAERAADLIKADAAN